MTVIVSIRLSCLIFICFEAMFKTSDYVWDVCSGRYAEFAIHLNSQGYGVFGMDWIGILDIQPFTLLNSCFSVGYCLELCSKS